MTYTFKYINSRLTHCMASQLVLALAECIVQRRPYSTIKAGNQG